MESDQPTHIQAETVGNSPYIPSQAIKSSNDLLSTGVVYAIKNSHHQAYLHPGGKGGRQDRAFVQPNIHAPYQQWVIQKHTDGNYLLRNCFHNTSYLHPGGNGGRKDRAFVQGQIDAPFQQWAFQHKQGKKIAIRNQKHSTSYLHAGGNGGREDRAFVQEDIDKDYQLWQFQPQGSLKMLLTEFKYLDDYQEMIAQRTQVSFITSVDLTVIESTVGSSVGETFTKSISESFSLSFNQSFTVGVSVESHVSIPLLAGASITVSAETTVGSEQSWNTQKTNELSVEGILIPTEPGVYRMSGWADIVDNLELRYEALGEVTVLGKRMKEDGTVDLDKEMSGDAVLSFIKSYYSSEPDVVEVKESSVVLKITGKMKGTYGLRASFSTQKIG